jgi:hypothetical protein
MPMPRPIDSTLHGVTDYTVGALLTTVLPRVAGVEGTESAMQMRIAGATHAAYSTLTDYPLGVVKLIPYKVHLALDALGAIAVGALPFITGQYRKGPKHFVPHLALAAFELQSLLLSDPRGKGDFHGDVDAVRAANELNPHSRIYNGGPAVAAARG